MSSSTATGDLTGHSSPTSNLPFAGGALAGAGAAVVGYLLTYLWQANAMREQMEGVNFIIEFFGGEAIPAWKAVGWLTFNAHFVDYLRPAIGGGQVSENFIAAGDAPMLLYLVPVVMLVGAGFLLAWTDGAMEPSRGAAVGATTILGYLPFAVAGVFLFAVNRGDATIQPDPVTGILLAGIIFPLVLGAIGGVVASAFE